MKGSIYPGSKTGRTWRLVYDLPRDIDGRRRQKWETFKGTKKEADALLARRIHEIETGQSIEPGTSTLAAFLDEWLKWKDKRVSDRTHRDYSWIIEKHIKPGIGNIRLDKLRPLHVKRWYDRLEANNAGIQTIRHIHSVLRMAVRQAVRWQMLQSDVTAFVDPPRLKVAPKKALSAEQANALLAAAKPTVFYIPILLGIYTGMRCGEALALRWEDVDFDEGKIWIHQALDVGPGGVLSFHEPKTSASNRPNCVPSIVIQALKEHRDRQWAAGHVSGLVCLKGDGKLILPAYLRHSMPKLTAAAQELLSKQAGRKVDFPHTTYHILRHTHISLLGGLGVWERTISARVGHANPGLTVGLYSHSSEAQDRAAAEQFAELLSRFG